MKQIIAILFLAAIASGCNPLLKMSKKVLPGTVLDESVYFGMPLHEFQQKNPQAQLTEENMSFRTVYISEPADPAVKSIVYYFDNDGDKPMYEVIINYASTTVRDNVADKLFGQPNYDGDEWKFPDYEPYPIAAWTFQSKLVVVALIPKSEWAEEEEVSGE